MFIHALYSSLPKATCESILEKTAKHTELFTELKRFPDWSSLCFSLEEVLNRTSAQYLSMPSLVLSSLHYARYNSSNFANYFTPLGDLTCIVILNDSKEGSIVFRESSVPEEANTQGTILIFDSSLNYIVSRVREGEKSFLISYFDIEERPKAGQQRK